MLRFISLANRTNKAASTYYGLWHSRRLSNIAPHTDAALPKRSLSSRVVVDRGMRRYISWAKQSRGKRIALILISSFALCLSLARTPCTAHALFSMPNAYWCLKETCERKWNNDLSFRKRRICMFEWAGGSLFFRGHNEKVMCANTRSHPFIRIWIFDPEIEHYPMYAPCICVFFCSCRKSNFFNMLHELILTFTQRHLRQRHRVKYLCFVRCYRVTGVLLCGCCVGLICVSVFLCIDGDRNK